MSQASSTHEVTELRTTEPAAPHVTESRPAPVVQADTPVRSNPSPNGSGLVQIETDAHKRAIASATDQIATTSATPRRRSRPREIYSAESSEPLVQIETQKPT